MDFSHYVEKAIERIATLCKIPSPTGYTHKATDYLKREFETMGYPVVQSVKGAISVCIGGEGHPLILAAHVDTLGAMVRSIKGNGRIRFTKIGGYPENYIETENVTIHTRSGKEYTGTVQLNGPAVHVYSDTNTKLRDDSSMEVVLDEIVKSVKDTQDLGIQVGDFISLDPRTIVTPSGFIKSRHLDDKASAGILMALAEWVKVENIALSRKVTLLFTTYEEVGHGGAFIPRETEEMISVDMGAVGDDLTTDEFKVSICAKDSGGPYDYTVTSRLIALAAEHKLQYAVDIYPRYGSDVEATLAAGYDIRFGLIGPGVDASHGYERTHKEGVLNTLSLLMTYVTTEV